MISKIHLTVNEEKTDVILEWDERLEDYKITNIPHGQNGLTRTEIIKLTDEIKRITDWE